MNSTRRVAREPGMSLGRAAAIFLAERPPKLLLAALLFNVGWRLTLPFDRYDLIPLLVIPLLHPFVEWLVHVFILHHRPRPIGGRTLDFHAAQHHRAHHRDPWDLRFVVIPLPALFVGSLISLGGWMLLMPTRGAAVTALVLTSITALMYEWVHYLTHTSYRAKNRLYRRLWRLHRLHHFKNENYWFGVTRHFGDVVLKTLPDPEAVETSDTARTLGIDVVGERG